MKKNYQYILYFIVILIINYRVSISFKTSFLEMTLPTGIICTIVIGLFSSKGGLFTQLLSLTDPWAAKAKSLDMKLDVAKAFKEESELVVFINKPFITAIVYTIISLIFNVIYYWEYFKDI